ncbi:HNH endonuclease [Raoultella planticola]|uniref:HNH endonuclease n=1 Tax=Raoultella planticola TaxID=575 RepID=UPI003A4C77DB
MTTTAIPAQPPTTKKKKKKKKLTPEQRAKVKKKEIAARLQKQQEKGGTRIESEAIFTAKGKLIRPVPPRLLKPNPSASQIANSTKKNQEAVKPVTTQQKATPANRAEIGSLVQKQIAAGSHRDFELWLHARRDSQQPNQVMIDLYLKEYPTASLQALQAVEAPAKREGGLTQVRTRPDQAAFSAAVRDNFRSACAVTGALQMQRCEAAHIIEHKYGGADHYTNGIWLRSDLHAIFDAGLCAIDPETMCLHFRADVLALDIDLKAYNGKAISQPRRPINPDFLKARWVAFLTLSTEKTA